MQHHTLLPRRQRALILSILLGWLALLTPAASLRAASVIYVVPGGAGAQTGADWASAKELQTALQGAASGNQIWVKAGVYKPSAGTDRHATFQLKSGVSLYGGFAGTETDLSQRDIGMNVTILSGDIDADDSPIANSYHVITLQGANSATLIDGFTITAGYADAAVSAANDHVGGGMYISNSNPTVRNMIFSHNIAEYGGGMMIGDNSNPVLSNVTFNLNSANYAGGGLANSHSNPAIIDAVFSQNSAAYGGGVYNEYSNPTISQTIFKKNNADMYGAGISNAYTSNTIISQSTFIRNSISSGGGIVANSSSNLILRNSILWDDSGIELYSVGNSVPDVQYTLIRGGYTGIGNLNSDPLFVSDPLFAGVENLRLRSGSPAISAGNPTSIPSDVADEDNDGDRGEPVPYDFSGSPRVLDSAVEMGAYEYTACAPPIIYVDSTANGAATGETWQNAYPDLQPALARAAVCTSTTQIWVAGGIYKPTTGSDRSATFHLQNGLALYGGFAGRETALNQRSTMTNTTILSGDLLGNDAGDTGISNLTRGDNSYHVLTADGVDSTAILNGLTVTAGNANRGGPNWTADSEGGGLRNNQGSPTITHVVFSHNSAIYGGGMVNNSPSSPILSQVSFIGNIASEGGGVVNFGGAPTISQAIFSGNIAAYGGGIYNYLSNPIIIHSTFSNNSAPTNGGGAMWNGYISSNPIVRNSIFWGNQGGQIITSQGAPDVQFSLIQGGYITGTHILDADPLFMDAEGTDNVAGTADDNLRLQAGSPAIDAGNNAFIPPDLTDDNHNNDVNEIAPFDLDGNLRLVNSTVDMGAYERQRLAITSAPPSATATYGALYSHTFTVDSTSALSFAISAGALPPGLTLTPNGVLSGLPNLAGIYSGITVTVSSSQGSASQTCTIVVHKAALMISADSKHKVSGMANPPLTASYSGFVNGDTPASLDAPAILTTTATIASPPGNYAITASGAADANYDITFASATLTITSGRTYLALVGR